MDLQFPLVVNSLSKGWKKDYPFIASDFGTERNADAGQKAKCRFEEHEELVACAY